MTARRLGYLASLVGCFVFYICYQKWLGWILFVCLLGLPVLSLALSLPAMLSFRLRVDGPTYVRQGAEAKLQMLGGSRFPIPPFRGKLRVTKALTGETATHTGSIRLATAHCGAVEAVPVKAKVFDYLCLFRWPVRHPEPLRVVIRPTPMKMANIPDLEGFLSRSWRPKPGGGFAENHELRLYRPGDSLNQVHWKLTAKTGNLIIREAMIPEQGLVLVTADIRGTAEELDRIFGRLLWLGQFLLEKGLGFEIRALTGAGIQSYAVAEEASLLSALDALLGESQAGEGSVLDTAIRASWHCHVGGEADAE
jgi:uncharacterized protein (DUF58 family)